MSCDVESVHVLVAIIYYLDLEFESRLIVVT